MLVCPSQTVCHQMRNFDNFRLGAFFFLSIYDTLIECCQYTWEIRILHILVRVYKTIENSKVTVYYYIHACKSNLLRYFVDISRDCM